MAAPTSASGPSTPVTEIPGRFAPFVVVDKRNVSALTTSTATQAQLAYLPRAESASHDSNTPLTDVTELGTNFNVGDFDDIPDNKVSLSCYDVGPVAMSILTGKMISNPGTTTFGLNDLNTAAIDIIRQYADPAGNIFYSEYMQDHVIEEYSASLKAKAASMEAYSLVGFPVAGFRGFVQTKCYIAQPADATAHSFSIGAILGTDEAPYQIPSGTIQSMWNQMGCNYFLKIERWRPSTGWVRLKEGTVGAGVCQYTSGSTTLTFAASDLQAGDVFFLTYATYKTDATAMSTLSGVTAGNYAKIPQTSLDTSDPIAVPTRLTPITISANNIQRGQQFDLKFTLKRDRAEGIGDVTGMYGPSDAPAVSLSLDVKMTDAGLNGIMQSGTPNGSDNGGATSNDFFDPNLAVRNQLASTGVPVVVKVNDPRNSSTTLKTLTSPSAVFNQRSVQTPAKGMSTVKYSGKDVVGNITISVTH